MHAHLANSAERLNLCLSGKELFHMSCFRSPVYFSLFQWFFLNVVLTFFGRCGATSSWASGRRRRARCRRRAHLTLGIDETVDQGKTSGLGPAPSADNRGDGGQRQAMEFVDWMATGSST